MAVAHQGFGSDATDRPIADTALSALFARSIGILSQVCQSSKLAGNLGTSLCEKTKSIAPPYRQNQADGHNAHHSRRAHPVLLS